jgi:two-component system, cell cycle sensor histidine kinase and response regulator CckA
LGGTVEPVLSDKRLGEGMVLVIDDEPYMAKATSRLLRSMGFDFLIAATGQDAVQICRARGDEIDVVLLDMVLPEMSSIETLRQMRALRPGIKVILMSGYGKQESVDRFAGMGLDGFVSKPFGYSELENVVRAALNRSNT